MNHFGVDLSVMNAINEKKGDTVMNQERYNSSCNVSTHKSSDPYQYIQEIYEEYYAYENDSAFSELVIQIDKLYAKYVKNLLISNGCFNDDTEHTAMQEARKAVWERILKCRECGEKDTEFARYCKGIYYHKSMDVIRQQTSYKHKFGGKIGAYPISMDAPLGDDNRCVGDLIEDKKVRPEEAVSKKEIRRVFNKLFILYCHSLVSANAEPARELALYYARILPHLLHIDFGIETIPDTKAASAKWAYEHMGTRTIGNLGFSSEKEMKEYISDSLCWCDLFWEHLEEFVPFSTGRIALKDAVYTSLYNKGKIEDWSESMHKTVVKATVKEVMKDPKLKESAIEYISDRDKIICLVKGGRER